MNQESSSSQTTKPSKIDRDRDLLDRQEYFGTTNSDTLSPQDVYPITNSSNKKDLSSLENAPQIDRNNKPQRFRNAHEMLFGRSEKRDADYNAPEYINTAAVLNSRADYESNERATTVTNGRGLVAFGDNSSYSSDSYNKYGSPFGTFDKRFNQMGLSPQRPAYNPYRFTRSTAFPAQITGSTLKQNTLDRVSKPLPTTPKCELSNSIAPSPPKPVHVLP